MAKNSDKLTRKHKITIKLNDKELNAFNKYLKKYRIENRSKFVREVLFTHILEQFDKDYPSLFPDTNENNNTINFDE